MRFKTYILTLFLLQSCFLQAEKIPFDKILPIEELPNYLKQETLQSSNDKITEATLAAHFRQTFKERFFYDWETVNDRFTRYNTLYKNQGTHTSRANDHLAKYVDSTQWKLPFNYQNGKPVNAYALRHLARQHKMVDIAYLYFYDNKDPKYIRYFTRQMQSLNAAFETGKYEKIEDGNGVYEAFRSGYRVLNWLSIHNLFLGEEAYSDKDQLYTIATLLQHASHLYERNSQFRYGNHQTRGLSALAMLAILFRDFEDADLWYEWSMKLLGEHLDKEINADGFQFERSVHYHLSDISNYFYVYQLAQISEIEVDKVWEERLQSLFETLVKIAYPDKTAPVLQDDTDDPWAEKNQIARAMTLGYLLFNKPEFGYFADSKVQRKMYWFLQQKQLDQLQSIDHKKPTIGSNHFPETGYYIMREGWNEKDKMMIVSAGLDADKPDHQHGDMLGIQAMANGKVILPNYQVRYPLKDFDWFKNSMVKNVALVDNELQGKQWTGNKGGSGFGKFRELPNPKVISWTSDNRMDCFVGSHDGFSNIGVNYSRQVIYLKDDFWIVKDNFEAEGTHTYKQVWQGHYTDENGANLLRSSFDNGSGCDIFQLEEVDKVVQDGKRGKQWSVVEKQGQTDFSFITIIYPFAQYNNRIDEEAENPMLGNWRLNDLPFEWKGNYSLSKEGEAVLLGVSEVEIGGEKVVFSVVADVFVSWKEGERKLQFIGEQEVEVSIGGKKSEVLKSGESIDF